MYGTHTVLDFVLMRKLIHSNSALCTVSVRQFGILSSALLQIPSHNSHPRFWLTVSTANSVVDFHHQVIVYDGRSTLNKTGRSEEHTSELQSRGHLVCRLLLEKKKI